MRVPGAILTALFLFVGAAAGQEAYPSRPVQIVVPFPPGGVADVVARAIGPSLERQLKQPMVILNKAGAAGGVGMQFAATSRPDGYTLLLGLVSISTIPEVDKLFERPQSYTREQFMGIARLTADPPILVLRAESPWKSVKELVPTTGGGPAMTAVLGGHAEMWASPPALAYPQETEFKATMAKVETPIAYLEGEEFKAWWDRDAQILAEAVRRIGKVK